MEKLTKVAELTVSYKPIQGNLPLVKSSFDAYTVLKDFFPEEQIGMQEMFVVMYLNNAGKVIGVYRLSVGGITGTVADPRLILGTALKVAATTIIVAHNHPSGNLSASQSDIDLTRKLKEAGKFLEIQLLDHLIIAGQKYYSFADEGLL